MRGEKRQMSEISGAARRAQGAPSQIFLIASTLCQPRRENLLGLRDRECLSLFHDLG